MYPNLYYLFRELLGAEIPVLHHVTTFGCSIALSFIAGLFFLKKYLSEMEKAGQFKDRSPGLVDADKPAGIRPVQSIATWSLLAALAGLLGGKLFFLLENDPSALPADAFFSFAGINFYGALVAALLVTCLFFYLNNIKPLLALDAVAPGFMLAYCIGRLGCHISGDGDWGRVNTAQKPFSWVPDVFWAYRYPHNLIREGSIMTRCDWGNYCYQLDQPVFPSSLWEAVICFLLFLMLWKLRKDCSRPGLLFSTYLILGGLERFFIEGVRINPIITGLQLTQAQLISVIMVLTGLVLKLHFFRLNSKASGH